MPMSMGDVLRRSALNFPDKTALVFGNQRTTYDELNQRVNCVANSLLNMGLQKGDRVAVLLRNCPEFIEIYFACARCCGIFVPVNNLLRRNELADIFEYIEPRFLIFDDDFRDVVHSIVPEVKCIEFLIALNGESGVWGHYGSLVDEGERTEPDVTISDDDIVSIFLTSGTTGRP
jgi:acyl-CoA synthetase (AMP-forming)/AMP-acid ligase II